MSDTQHESDWRDPHLEGHNRHDHMLRHWYAKRLRTSGVKLNSGELAIEASGFLHALQDAVYARARTVEAQGGHPGRGRTALLAATYKAVRERARAKGKSIDRDLAWAFTLCDRRKIIESVLSIDGADEKAIFVADPDGHDDWTEERRAKFRADHEAAVKAIVDRRLSHLGQTVRIDAIAPIDITQDTNDGLTPTTGTYDPATAGAKSLILSDCTIRESGVRIEKLDSGHGALRQVASTTNGLSRYNVVLKSATRTQRVRPNATRLLYGSDLKESWTLSLEKVQPTTPRQEE